jgi:hypothetical protein
MAVGKSVNTADKLPPARPCVVGVTSLTTVVRFDPSSTGGKSGEVDTRISKLKSLLLLNSQVTLMPFGDVVLGVVA